MDRGAFEDGVSGGKLTSEARDLALKKISPASSIEQACRDADLIIEVAPEEIEMKIELFGMFDKVAKPAAILASNTTSLSITVMAAATSAPTAVSDCTSSIPCPR